ncbi:DUF262 domain-containing protein [Pantoea ananatis]|uniref:DUF262 domain-containing protein n=1 Tax=Pantoea ananas TaxID=553 RepID=UPI003FA4B9E8
MLSTHPLRLNGNFVIINPNNYSVLELLEMLERKDLFVNKSYQRHAGLWPDGPASYFIDTILEKYPFPKIYIYEYINPGERRMKKEVVDGQQRITTIKRFINNEFTVKGDSKYSGRKFSELPDDVQDGFLSYSVSVDVIRNATRSEILQMFRRMNAYTLPLNNAEKRHSSFSGSFKWFINELSDSLNDFFVSFGVFSEKQIVRMLDAEFLSEIIIAIEEGIISSSPVKLTAIYKKYDETFQGSDVYFSRIKEIFTFIWTSFEPLRNSFMMKPYALHSLFTALYISKYGIKDVSELYGIENIGTFTDNVSISLTRLEKLAEAHETKDWAGKYTTYLYGVDSSTNKISQRTARVFTILEALGVDIPEDTGYVNVFN